MKDWHEIVKLGMLGTEKGTFSPEVLPTALQPYLQTEAANDPEAHFLQAAALLLAYRRAGTQAATSPIPRLNPAETETLPYSNQQQNAILRKLLDEDVYRNKGLINLWLQQCAAQQRIVPPEFLPDLLAFKSTFAHLPAFRQVLGQRGLWLAQLRKKWTLASVDPEKIWEEGSTAERNELIQNIWKSDPAQALHYIQADWAAANAKERLAWAQGLQHLRDDLALSFAEEVYQNLKSTGTKGKDSLDQLLATVAAYLLSQPSSTLYQQVKPILQPLIQRSKGFLGLKEKVTLQLPSAFDAFFNEKNLAETLGLNSEKGLNPTTQIEVWFAQILAHLHPGCWEEVMGADWRLIFAAFGPDYYLPLAEALGRAGHQVALRTFITLPLGAATSEDILTSLRKKALLFHENSPFARLRPALEVLTQEEQEQFIRSLDAQQLAYFHQAIPELKNGEWSLKTSHLLFAEMCEPNKEQNAFQNFMLKQAWPYLHLGILPEMTKAITGVTGYSPEATLVYNYIRPLHQQLTVRQSIMQAFNNG